MAVQFSRLERELGEGGFGELAKKVGRIGRVAFLKDQIPVDLDDPSTTDLPEGYRRRKPEVKPEDRLSKWHNDPKYIILEDTRDYANPYLNLPILTMTEQKFRGFRNTAVAHYLGVVIHDIEENKDEAVAHLGLEGRFINVLGRRGIKIPEIRKIIEGGGFAWPRGIDTLGAYEITKAFETFEARRGKR